VQFVEHGGGRWPLAKTHSSGMYRYFARMPHCIEFIVSPLVCSFYAALAEKSALYDFGTDEGPNYRRRRWEKLGTAVKLCSQIKRAALNPNSALTPAP
jgi:hypothetical protein